MAGWHCRLRGISHLAQINSENIQAVIQEDLITFHPVQLIGMRRIKFVTLQLRIKLGAAVLSREVIFWFALTYFFFPIVSLWVCTVIRKVLFQMPLCVYIYLDHSSKLLELAGWPFALATGHVQWIILKHIFTRVFNITIYLRKQFASSKEKTNVNTYFPRRLKVVQN